MSPPEEDDETLVAGHLIQAHDDDDDDSDEDGETLLAAPIPVRANDPRRAAAIMGARAGVTRPLPLPTPPPPRPGSAPPPAAHSRPGLPPADFEPVTHTMELPRLTPPPAGAALITGPVPVMDEAALVEPATLLQRAADVNAVLGAPHAQVVLAAPEGTPPLVIRFLLVCGMLTVVGLLLLIYLQL